MTHRIKVLAAAAVVLAGSAAPLQAATDPGPLAVTVIETAVLPGYEAFAAATSAQAQAWAEACADNDFSADAAGLKETFGKAADAWSRVDYFTTGPIGEALRADRIYFSPDKRNYVAKALGELTARAKDGPLSADVMRGASVAGQGFPALERILFEPGAGEPATRCRVGVAIAQNLKSIAADIVTEWKAPEGPLAKLKKGEGDKLHFADPAQAAARLMTDLTGGVQRANDLKLLPVLGGSLDAARPKAADGWRSGRAARVVQVSVASIAATAKVVAASAPADVAKADAKAFDAAQAAVAKLPQDLGEAAADPKRRKLLEAAVAALKVAQADLVKNVAPALGLPLGFNALDGD